MIYSLGPKGQEVIDGIEKKIFGGEEYWLCDRNADTELWLKAPGPIQLPKCVRCGYQGVAVDRHHVYGRKNSDETIYLCSNCHRELHAGEWEYVP